MNADTLAAARARHAKGGSLTQIAKALGISRPASGHPSANSPEALITVSEPHGIRGPLTAEIAGSRSSVRRFLDERFAGGLRDVQRRYREAGARCRAYGPQTRL